MTTTQLKLINLSTEMFDANQISSSFVNLEGILTNGDISLSGNINLGNGIIKEGVCNSIAVGGSVSSDNSIAIGYRKRSNGTEDRAEASTPEGDTHQGNAFAFGYMAKALNYNAFATGSGTASGPYSVCLCNGNATNELSFASGYKSLASGEYSIALGENATANGKSSFALTNGTANGYASVALKGKATNDSAVSLGGTASGIRSVSEGENTTASGKNSHAQNQSNTASGESSTATGLFTKAQGKGSFTLGYYTEANGVNSVAGGHQSIANGESAFSLGNKNIAIGLLSIALGTYSSTYLPNQLSSQDVLSVQIGDIIHWDTDNKTWVKANDYSGPTTETTFGSLNAITNNEYNITLGKYPLSSTYYKIIRYNNKLKVLSITNELQLANNSFVWAGKCVDDANGTGVKCYHSHGEGTFNINPKNGLKDFYIGENNFLSCITEAIKLIAKDPTAKAALKTELNKILS